MAKVCWAMQIDPAARCRYLAKWCKENGFPKEAAFYDKSAKALGQALSPDP
jgi:hypothetical protein